MKKVILLTILNCLSIHLVKGQESDKYKPNITPPAPSVNSLMKFEEVPVSHYTGVPDISIPISSMPTGLKNVNINLSLKYHTLSIKPDDRASEAGIGWSLFSGGTISRTVIDLPDELETISVSNGNSKHKFGIYMDDSSGGSNTNYTKKFIETIEAGPGSQLSLDNDNYRKLLYEAYYQNKFDNSYDLYQYSFLDYSGRFIITKNNGILTPVSLDKNNLKIKCNHTVNAINSFEITDEYGNTFIFDVKETSNTNFFASSQNIFDGDNINSGYNSPYTSSYHLSSIKSPLGSEFVSLQYYPEKEISIGNLSRMERSYQIPINFDVVQKAGANSALPKRSEYSNNMITTKTRPLQAILIKDKGKLYFEYDYGRQDGNYEGSLIANLPRLKEIKMFDASDHLIEDNVFFHNYANGYGTGRLTLNGVKKYDRNNSLISEYNLEYYPYQPDMVEDDWKYLKCNDDFGFSYRADCVRAGQLKSMTLPTKGKVEFDYEANTYSYHPDSENFSPNTVEVSNYDDNELNWDAVSGNVNFINFNEGEKFAFSISNSVKVAFNFNFDLLTQNNYQWYFKLLKKEGSTYIAVAGTGPGLDPTSTSGSYTIASLLLQPGDYYYKLEKYSPGSVPNFNLGVNAYYKVKNQEDYRFLVGGGVRIKNVKYYDKNDGTLTLPAKMTEYLYNSPDNDKKSSGALVVPMPMHEYSDLYKYSFFYYADSYLIYTEGNNVFTTNSKDNFLNVQKTKGGDIGYQYVVQKETGKGRTFFQFSSPIDYPNLSLPNLRPPFLPAENYDFRRGNLLNKKVYRENEQSPVIEEKFEYNETVTQTVPLGVGLKFIAQGAYDEFLYGSVFKTYDEYKSAHDNTNIVINGQTVLDHPYRKYCLELTKDSYNFISYYVKKEIIGKTNLAKHETINYFPNQKFVKTTQLYQYNTQDYPTLITETHSDGSLNETSYKYANEKGNLRLVDANIIAEPLETQIKNNNKIVGKTETLYSDNAHFFPTSVLSLDPQTSAMNTEITYDKYDSQGHLQQYTTKDGISTTIIWGYNNTQPIAKIIGAKLSDIDQSLIDTIVSASNTDAAAGLNNDETTLLSALNTFRTDSGLSGYQVTTYTYDPLVGVRSITPPSGIREVYIYDSANRLKEVREQNQTGKLLKEYQYNYKH